MNRYTYSLFLLLTSFVSFAQSGDTVKNVLSFDDYYTIVINNHPVIKQANLLPQQARQQLRLAKGAFDPKIEAKWDYKDLTETNYWNLLDVGMKVPTWFPIDPKFGFERNRGDFVNPENSISSKTNNEQIYAGVSVPLGKGLFIDQRRAVVRQARLFQEMAEAEQIKEINKALLNATKSYWEWYNAFENYQLMEQSIAIADDIFQRTKQAFDYGEAAMIDTVQAQISLQKRRIDFENAKIEKVKATLMLSNNLWDGNGLPLDLADDVIPEEFLQITLEDSVLGELYASARANHPELMKLRLKQDALQIDQSLARENLKPQIDISYVLLDQPFSPEGGQTGLDLEDNFKVGVDFSFPIFLRKERAKLKQTQFKIIDNELAIGFNERRILNDINSKYNVVLTTSRLIQQQQGMVNNYEIIVRAERLNLIQGESDLFKLNAQLDKLIESKTKLFKLKSTYQKDIAELYWIAGIRNLGN